MCQVPFPRGLPKGSQHLSPSHLLSLLLFAFMVGLTWLKMWPRPGSRSPSPFVGLLVINAKPGSLDWLYHCLVSCSVVSIVQTWKERCRDCCSFPVCQDRQSQIGKGCTVALILVTEHTTSVNLNHSQWVFLEIIQTPMMNHIQHTVLHNNAGGIADILRAKVMQRRMLGGLG